ncbi:portal protein [Pacificimonas sp. ICDLI1SI03]
MSDESTVTTLLADQARMESERSEYDATNREIEYLYDPGASGGYRHRTPGRNGSQLFDMTGVEAAQKYRAAVTGLMFPRGSRWGFLTTTSGELNRDYEARRWLTYANDRLHSMRASPYAGFQAQAAQNVHQGGLYGIMPFLADEVPGRGYYYRTLHSSAVWIDEDFRGRPDKVHLKRECTFTQLEQEFGLEALPDQARKRIAENQGHEKTWVLRVIRRNPDRRRGQIGANGMAWESLHIAMDEKHILRRKGYYSKPLIVARADDGPNDAYGRSPAMSTLPQVRMLQEMARSNLRAAQRMAEPPLLTSDDDELIGVIVAPGQAIPGGLDERGNPLVQEMRSAANIPIGLEMQDRERRPVQEMFLSSVFELLMNSRDRMTATEVLHLKELSGLLVGPVLGQLETEWVGPMIERELDIGLRSGAIPPPPPVMREAMRAGQAGIRVELENPLTRMARASEATGLGQLLDITTPIANIDPGVWDIFDTENMGRELADVLGVRPTFIASPDMVAAKKAAREDNQAQAVSMEALEQGAGAIEKLARAQAVAA